MLWFLLMLVTGFLALRGFVLTIGHAARADNGSAVVLLIATGVLGFVTYVLAQAAFAT